MVDRASAELDGELNGTWLGELGAAEPQGEPGRGARLEVAPRLRHVEGTTLEEHVRGLGDARSFWQDFREREVEVCVGIDELGRHGMRAEPGRDSSRAGDRTQRRELRVAVEPVAGLRLEGRRPGAQHPATMR